MPSFKPQTSPKQDEVIALCVPSGTLPKFVCLSGPRLTGKSIGGLHAVCHRAWETNFGRWSIVTPTTSTGSDGGVWSNFIDFVLPQWINAGFGMELVTPPRQDGVTKKHYLEVSNKWGNKTRIQLDSLQYEAEVEARFKNRVFSGIFVTEMDYFKDQLTFKTWSECLRMPHLKPNEHLLLGDTNPAVEGPDHWIYHLWYVLKNITDASALEELIAQMIPHYDEMGEQAKQGMRDSLKMWQSQLHLREFFLEDNPFITEEQRGAQRIKWSYDPDVYARYVEGKWVRVNKDGAFSKVFRPNWHVVGERPTAFNPAPKIMLPESYTDQFGVGWDLGASRNHAVALIEDVPMFVKDKPTLGFKMLDEIVLDDNDSTIAEITEMVMERMARIEELAGRVVRWEHFSDRSAFDHKESITNRTQAMEVYIASGGKIAMKAAEKPHDSVNKDVGLVQRLLVEDRLFISERCVRAKAMFQNIPKGKTCLIDKTSEHKHILDALRYYLRKRLEREIVREVRQVNVGVAPVVNKITRIGL